VKNRDSASSPYEIENDAGRVDRDGGDRELPAGSGESTRILPGHLIRDLYVAPILVLGLERPASSLEVPFVTKRHVPLALLEHLEGIEESQHQSLDLESAIGTGRRSRIELIDVPVDSLIHLVRAVWAALDPRLYCLDGMVCRPLPRRTKETTIVDRF